MADRSTSDMRSVPSNFLTATETQALLRSGQLSTRQVLADHIARYEERNAQTGAWVHVNHDRMNAGGIENSNLPLYGVTLGVKDIMGERSRVKFQ